MARSWGGRHRALPVALLAACRMDGVGLGKLFSILIANSLEVTTSEPSTVAQGSVEVNK